MGETKDKVWVAPEKIMDTFSVDTYLGRHWKDDLDSCDGDDMVEDYILYARELYLERERGGFPTDLVRKAAFNYWKSTQ